MLLQCCCWLLLGVPLEWVILLCFAVALGVASDAVELGLRGLLSVVAYYGVGALLMEAVAVTEGDTTVTGAVYTVQQ